MDDVLASIIADALGQAEELPLLDAVRAELWASDLMALAQEAGPEGLDQVIAALVAEGGPGPTAALWALDAMRRLDPEVGEIDPWPCGEPRPVWADHLGSSTCEAAWLVSNWRGSSAVFRFVDQADDRHVVIVDLVPSPSEGGPERVGGVVVGPAEVLDAFEDPEAKLTAEPADAEGLARRVGAALGATTEPGSSLVAAGRLLLSRLGSLGVHGLPAPVWVEPEVSELPAVDPEERRWARSVVGQALGSVTVPDCAEPARVLRGAAAVDGPLAQWLAASRGPVDLDDDDAAVVRAALAATVAPATVAPLTPEARDAVGVLEYADWLGVVIELVRSGPGASIEPDGLVDLINRCPEVASTIPKADRVRVAWALGVCTEVWEPLGLSAGGRLTEQGVALLPAMLLEAWADEK